MSDREELIDVIWSAGDVPEETAMEIADAVIGWQEARAQGGEAVACPYHCGWPALQSIVTKNAAWFARATIGDEIPEDVRQSGIASGQYALELLKFARGLAHPSASVPDGWIKCSESGPEFDEAGNAWLSRWIEDLGVWEVDIQTHDDVYAMNGRTREVFVGAYWMPTGLKRPAPPEQGAE